MNQVSPQGQLKPVYPWHEANPYDSVGFWHNEALGYIQSHKVAGAPDRQKNQQLVLSFARMHQLYVPAALFGSVEKVISDSASRYANIIAGLPYTHPVKKELSVVHALLTDYEQREEIGYPDFYNRVVSYEQELLQRRDLTEGEQKIILMVTSVARFSASYWSQKSAVAGKGINWNKIWRWCAYVHVDIINQMVTLNSTIAADASEYMYDLLGIYIP